LQFLKNGGGGLEGKQSRLFLVVVYENTSKLWRFMKSVIEEGLYTDMILLRNAVCHLQCSSRV